MPILKDYRKIEKVKLDVIKGGEIEIYESLLAADIRDLTASGNQENQIDILQKMIKGWNLTDEQENVLPVNAENIGKLDVRDLLKMINASKITPDFLEKGKSEVSEK